MPILKLNTNLPKTVVPLEFGIKTCKIMADIFKSPMHFCAVQVNADQEIYWYGLDGPCIFGTLKIVSGSGKIGPKENITHAKILIKHISDSFKLPDKNISLSFIEQDSTNVTIFNTTVSNFLQQSKN